MERLEQIELGEADLVEREYRIFGAYHFGKSVNLSRRGRGSSAELFTVAEKRGTTFYLPNFTGNSLMLLYPLGMRISGTTPP